MKMPAIKNRFIRTFFFSAIAFAAGIWCGIHYAKPNPRFDVRITKVDADGAAAGHGLQNKPDELPDKPGGARSSMEEQDFYQLPKRVLSFLDVTAWSYSGGLDSRLMKALGIMDAEKPAIDQAGRDLLEELKRLESANSELIRDKDGNQYFRIKPYDSSVPRTKLKAELFRILKDDRAAFLTDLYSIQHQFGMFGKYPQEISVQELEMGGKTVTRLAVEFSRDGTAESLVGTYYLGIGDEESNKAIMDRFGAIYGKAGVSLIEK